MTDNEIIKALECVQKETCFNCHHTVAKEALDLINRQKAEIERLQGRGLYEVLTERAWRIIQDLKAENERLEAENKEQDQAIINALNKMGQIRAEAIKEFGELLCEGRVSNDPVVIAVKAEWNMMFGREKEKNDE